MKCMLNMDISCFENRADQDQLASEMQADHNPVFHSACMQDTVNVLKFCTLVAWQKA